MNLIIAIDALFPPLTGIGRYTKELVSRIQISEDVQQLKYYLHGRWVLDPLSIPVTGNVTFESPKIPKAFRQLYLTHTLQKSVFHSPNFFLPTYVERGVATIHDLSVLKFPETHPIERVREYEKKLLATLGVAQHLITGSETVRQEIIDYYGWPSQRVTAIYNGVPETYKPYEKYELIGLLRRYGLKHGAYTLCVSTIEPRKRIENLILAYAKLPIYVRLRFPLVLVGDKGWQSGYQHSLIEEAQRNGWLLYLGFVEERDLPLIYAGARLFVYPSIYEGFGLPIAEAMACGVPVMTSDRSCLPEISGGAAKLINPDDLDEFAVSLEACLIDPVWRETAIANGLQVVKKYSWHNSAQQTLNIYKQVAQ